MKQKPSRRSRDGIAILHKRFYAGKPQRLVALEEARAADDVARKLIQLRTSAGLTQRQLAKIVGTTPSVICRLEDADYAGHSLSMLRRIASALSQRVEISFLPAKKILRAA
jgi:DNA-binding XRE family transcriptional regulator